MAVSDYEICALCMRKLAYIGENDRHPDGVVCMECLKQREHEAFEAAREVYGPKREVMQLLSSRDIEFVNPLFHIWQASKGEK